MLAFEFKRIQNLNEPKQKQIVWKKANKPRIELVQTRNRNTVLDIDYHDIQMGFTKIYSPRRISCHFVRFGIEIQKNPKQNFDSLSLEKLLTFEKLHQLSNQTW